MHFLSVEENRRTVEVFNHVVKLVAVAVAVADFRISISMLSPAVMIVINTEVLSASSATRMDISQRTVRTTTNRTLVKEKVPIWPNSKELH